MTDLEKLLVKHEGLELAPYYCPAGDLTIGVGRNLEAIGLSAEEWERLFDGGINHLGSGITADFAMFLLENDIVRVRNELDARYEFFGTLDKTRRDVLIDMAFNLGIVRFSRFRRMIAAIERMDYKTAAIEMMDSKWATQVGPRAKRLADMMRTGKYAELN